MGEHEGDLCGMKALLDRAVRLERRRMIVVCPYDMATLSALSRARRKGFVEPVLVGNVSTVRENAKAFGVDIDGMDVVDCADEAAPELSARMIREGEGHFIMKGIVGTGRLLQILLDPKRGIRMEKILSHVALLEVRDSRRVFLMSDAAINIQPNFNRKVQIVLNAVQAARLIGVPRVRVAMLAAVEKVTLPAMPATLDAFLMKKFAQTGVFGECDVEGPFALDNAIDPKNARTKGIGGEVAGKANVVIVPNIETGNVIYKSITCLEKREAAGVVLGARCPIVVPSRSDDSETKLLSIQFARLLMG